MTPFSFNFTADQVAKFLPAAVQTTDWFTPLAKYLQSADIYTPKRVAAFMAQTAHESGNYLHLSENLNYGAAGLRATFPKKFLTDDDANAYARQPQKIANRVYANMIGNGDEASGDGWKFHGRGVLQITGRDNYAKCSQYMYQDDRLIINPDLLTFADGAVASAVWFWATHNLNHYADIPDNHQLTYHINGGYNGEDDRNRLLVLANGIFC